MLKTLLLFINHLQPGKVSYTIPRVGVYYLFPVLSANVETAGWLEGSLLHVIVLNLGHVCECVTVCVKT